MPVKKVSRLALVALLPFLLVTATAKAEPTIPPSEECLSETENMLQEYDALVKNNQSVDDAKERALWKPLVDAGCLLQNPANEIEPTSSCTAYLGQATAYLAPANAAMHPFAKQIRGLVRGYTARERALAKKIKKARKLGQKKRVRVLKSKVKQSERNFNRSYRKVSKKAAPSVSQYRAPVVLVASDLYTRGCKPTKAWFRTNTDAFYAVYIFLGVVSSGGGEPLPEESLSLNF